MRRLNLGAGRDIKAGYRNLDRVILSGIDVVADLEEPLPFEDNVFEEITCDHVLEHVGNLLPLLSELHRVALEGASIHIVVPHLSFFGAYTDPTHRRFFGYHSFDYFTDSGVFNFYTHERFKIRERKILFYWIKNEKRIIRGRLVTWLINLLPLLYERFLCWMLPANEVSFVLTPVKGSPDSDFPRDR